MSLFDTGAWLADNLLERGDRMTMSASVELRPPFLDAAVVDLALRLPSNVKLYRNTSKWVVKEVARNLLPKEIIERPKSGFKVPLDDWFRHGLKDMAHDRLLSSDSLVCEVFDRSEIVALLESHLAGSRDEAIGIWTLLSLEVWHDEFFKQPRPRSRSRSRSAP
jgi:asparagine synthase (glutamine-hydrolysing)